MIDWNRIDSVFLDMDGTLLDLNFDNHFWREFVPGRFAERHGLSLEEAKAELMPRLKRMEGRLEWYCLDYWSRELALDMAGLKEEVAGLIRVLPHVTEFLGAVRGAGKQLTLVTNAHPKSLGLKMEKTCLHRFFEHIVCSHDLGIPKEHPAFWSRMESQEPFDRLRTLLVDDSLAVVRSARDYGIEHLVVVAKPDSRQAARVVEEFFAIEDLRQIMPPSEARERLKATEGGD